VDRTLTGCYSSKRPPPGSAGPVTPTVTHSALYERWVRAAAGKRVLLVESEDARVREAARRLVTLGVLPILPAHGDDAQQEADAHLVADGSADRLIEAGQKLERGAVDACVAGAVTVSPAVLSAALQTVGRAPGSVLVSSIYLMLLADGRTLGYADCVVNPRPDPAALASIAADSARTFGRLTGELARVAMLSFSTAGSARHPDVTSVQDAVRLAREQHPDLLVDGELQLDAAIVPEIAAAKAPHSAVGGRANVLVFPNLEAGNIAYKITERLAGAVAAGPVLQGLAKPYFDVSRGSSTEDIVRQCLLAAAMSQDSGTASLPAVRR
jgi:phosphotransacetylase